MNRQEKTDIESTLAHASLPVFSAKGAAITVAEKFSVTLETIRRPRQDIVLSNAAAMLLMALEKKTELLEWAMNQILPSHLLYTLTQVLVQEARRDWDKLNTVPALTPILDRLGGPVSEKTRRMVLSERVDPKTATVALIHDLWGRSVGRSSLDTAYTKKGDWTWREAVDLLSCMLKGTQILEELPPRRVLGSEEKRWAVLMGAHIHRASMEDTDYQFELFLAENLLPQAQRVAWLRDVWLRAGERAFPLMIQIEPLLAKLSASDVRAFASRGSLALNESERTRAADRALQEMLEKVGVELGHQELKNARNRQGTLWDTRQVPDEENG